MNPRTGQGPEKYMKSMTRTKKITEFGTGPGPSKFSWPRTGPEPSKFCKSRTDSDRSPAVGSCQRLQNYADLEFTRLELSFVSVIDPWTAIFSRFTGPNSVESRVLELFLVLVCLSCTKKDLWRLLVSIRVGPIFDLLRPGLSWSRISKIWRPEPDCSMRDQPWIAGFG